VIARYPENIVDVADFAKDAAAGTLPQVAWIDGRPESLVVLRKGDTIAVPPETPHAFRVVGDETLRLLGTHVSPKRIVNYQDGAASDPRGYRSEVS